MANEKVNFLINIDHDNDETFLDPFKLQFSFLNPMLFLSWATFLMKGTG